MSTEAFIWNYRDGEPVGFDFDTVRAILATDDVDWLEEFGCLRVRFRSPDDCVDIYLGKGAPASGRVDGITVSGPIQHPGFVERVFQVMQLGDVMLFRSDDTTPVFCVGADAGQYPSDLLEELGNPKYVSSPIELLHSA